MNSLLIRSTHWNTHLMYINNKTIIHMTNFFLIQSNLINLIPDDHPLLMLINHLATVHILKIYVVFFFIYQC